MVDINKYVEYKDGKLIVDTGKVVDLFSKPDPPNIKELAAEVKAILNAPIPPQPAPQQSGIDVSQDDDLQEAVNDAGSTPINLKGYHSGSFVLKSGTHLRAQEGESPLLTGAMQVKPEAWEKNGNYYYMDWDRPLWQHPAHSNRGGAAGAAHKRAMQPHMIIVDGKPLKTVYAHGEMDPGCMYLEGTAQSPRAIWVRLPGDKAPDDFLILAAVHQKIITAAKNAAGITIENINTRYCANSGDQGAIHFPEGARNWTLRHVDTQWSNTEGIRVRGSDHLLIGLVTKNHGQSGLSSQGMVRSRIDDIVTSYNNWKGFDQKWDAGNKLRNSKDNTITNLVALGNVVWLDIWNTGNTFRHFRIIDAPCWGLHVEHHSSGNRFIDGEISGTTICRGS